MPSGAQEFTPCSNCIKGSFHGHHLALPVKAARFFSKSNGSHVARFHELF